MANESIQPYTGPQTIDLTPVASALVDLAPGGMRGLRREQPGIENVILELQSSMPTLGEKAAISPTLYANFEQTHDMVLKIRAARQIVDKVAEVLAESEAYYEDLREGDISVMASSVRAAARHKDESIIASFEKMLAYNGQAALKAAKTRKKNADADADGDAGEGAPEGVTPKDEPQPPTGDEPKAP